MRTHACLVGAAMLLAVSGIALGDPGRGECQPPPGGPCVHDRAGAGHGFRGAPCPQERAGPRVAPREFFGALRQMGAEDAPENVKLTEEQRQELRTIAEEFREEARRMHGPPPEVEPRGERRRHREQGPPPPSPPGVLDERAERRGPPPPPGGPDGSPPPPPPADDERGADERRGPDPAAYFARALEVLDEDQRAFLRERLDETRADRAVERERPARRHRRAE